MSILQRAVLIADERKSQSLIRDLRGVLAKVGLRDVLCTESMTDVSNIVYASQWPLVFIDHDVESSDGLRTFERIFRMLGNQLFHYFLILPSEEKVMSRCFRSLGFSGVIRKPFQQLDVNETVGPFIFKTPDLQVKYSHEYTLALLKKDLNGAEMILKRLKSEGRQKLKVEMARVFLSDAQGAGPKVMSIFQKLLKDESPELRVLCDYVYFLKKFSIYDECAAVMEKIFQRQPLLGGKIWEEILFFAELEKLDDIALRVEKLIAMKTNPDDVDCLLARMINQFGLESQVPKLVIKGCSDFDAYQQFLQKEKEKQEKAAAKASPALKSA
ncbi:MAG: hypothetical protein RLZZ488_714 [Pseudomonadota bacterium]